MAGPQPARQGVHGLVGRWRSCASHPAPGPPLKPPPVPFPPSRPRPERDPLPDVKDAKVAVAQALGRMAATQPGRVPQLVAAALSPEQQQALAGYCAAAGVTIA